MVSPAQRRAWVRWVVETFAVSTRAACRATGVPRATIAYRSQRAPQTALPQRLRELAAARVSYGYLRLTTLLRREGWRVNHESPGLRVGWVAWTGTAPGRPLSARS